MFWAHQIADQLTIKVKNWHCKVNWPGSQFVDWVALIKRREREKKSPKLNLQISQTWKIYFTSKVVRFCHVFHKVNIEYWIKKRIPSALVLLIRGIFFFRRPLRHDSYTPFWVSFVVTCMNYNFEIILAAGKRKSKISHCLGSNSAWECLRSLPFSFSLRSLFSRYCWVFLVHKAGKKKLKFAGWRQNRFSSKGLQLKNWFTVTRLFFRCWTISNILNFVVQHLQKNFQRFWNSLLPPRTFWFYPKKVSSFFFPFSMNLVNLDSASTKTENEKVIGKFVGSTQ